jgi:hypothetical protein
MKKLALLITCLLVIKIKSQTSNWTKDDRNNLYSDCMSYSTKYKNLSGEQKESICLCYLEETTKKYIKTDFESKIDIEIKRIKDAMLTQCAKNLGLELNTQAKEESKEIIKIEKEIITEKKEDISSQKNTPTVEVLIGRWKTDKGSTIEFKDGGKFSEINLKGKEYSGDWFLDGKVLTISLQEGRTQIITKKETTKLTIQKYDFDFFSKDFIKYRKVGIAETIQANRIK